jgi:hypothetical protein
MNPRAPKVAWAVGMPVVNVNRACTERYELEQAAGHHHVFDEMKYLVWIGEVGMK